ncbi:cell division GTPase FtsZ [Rhizobium tibeticum]|nr:cell division GTPase FtsZ [Rhizobium tibeticum]
MMDPVRKMTALKTKIAVIGVGGGGGNAVDNMIAQSLSGVDLLVANTDAQALTKSKKPKIVQLGLNITEGLGAGSHPLSIW